MRGRALGVAVLAVVLGACSGDPETTDASDRPQPTSSSPASETPTGAFFLDLRTGTRTPLPNTSVETGDTAFDAGHYYAVSPDGSVVYWEDPCRDCSDGFDIAAVAGSDGSRGRRIDPPGPINSYAGGWSPDGTRIVYQRRDGREAADFDFGDLVVEDVGSGRTTRIDLELGPAVDGWWYLAPTFRSDGRSVIFHLPRESASGAKWDLWSVPVAGGEPTLVVRNAAQAATFHDGPTYAFVRPVGDGFAGSSLVIATPDGLRTLVDGSVGIWEPKMSPDGTRIAYGDDDSIYVVDVATGASTEVAEGRMATWLDDDTLIVAPDA